MPRVLGVNLVAWLAGAAAMYFVGFLFYGLVFQEVWSQNLLADRGIVSPNEASALTGAALLDAMSRIPQQLDMGVSMGLGFVISLVTAFFVATVLRLMRATSLPDALMKAGVIWLGFSATTLAYDVIYSAASPTIFAIDLGHTLCGLLAAAAVIFAIDGKAIVAVGQPATR